MSPLTILLIVAGVLHFSLLTAGASAVKVLNWKEELRRVDPLSRQLIWVHGVFVAGMIAAFGVITLVHAGQLADGASLLARTVCGGIALFWGIRLTLQFTYFNARAHTCKNAWLKLGYNALPFLFAYFTAVYGFAALQPA